VSIGKAHYNGTGNDHIIIYCALEAPSKQGGTLSHNLLHYAGHITKALHPLLDDKHEESVGSVLCICLESDICSNLTQGFPSWH
jgi:hypothetical protein